MKRQTEEKQKERELAAPSTFADASQSPAETSGATVSSFAVVVTGSNCVTPAESAAFLSPASAVV